jgi:hypothetical protein
MYSYELLNEEDTFIYFKDLPFAYLDLELESCIWKPLIIFYVKYNLPHLNWNTFQTYTIYFDGYTRIMISLDLCALVVILGLVVDSLLVCFILCFIE